MIPPDIAATMRRLLVVMKEDTILRTPQHRVAELLAPIDAALHYLGTLPAAPDWSSAPEWAMWWCVNAAGWPAWFSHKPEIGANGLIWVNAAGPRGRTYMEYQRVKLPIGIDWRTTLHARPTEDE